MKQPAAATPALTTGYMLGFIAVCAALYACKIAGNILIPFVVAVFVWYLINAIARFSGTVQVGGLRLVSRFWRFTLAILTVLLMMFLVYKMVYSNIDDVIHAAPKYQKSFAKIIPQVAGLLGLDHVPTLGEFFHEVVAQHVNIGAVIAEFAQFLTGMATKSLVVLFYVGFLLYEQQYFDRKIRLMIRDQTTEDRIRNVLKTIDRKIQKYIGVKAFVSALDSTLTFLILSAFDVDFAGFWGVMAFFLHFIPYAGSFVAITMPVMISLIQFGDISVSLMVLASLATSHAFLGHVLDPYLMGSNLNLSPIFIISNLAMWGMIWGIPGMFLAIPILASVTIALAQFDKTRSLAILISKTGHLKDG